MTEACQEGTRAKNDLVGDLDVLHDHLGYLNCHLPGLIRHLHLVFGLWGQLHHGHLLHDGLLHHGLLHHGLLHHGLLLLGRVVGLHHGLLGLGRIVGLHHGRLSGLHGQHLHRGHGLLHHGLLLLGRVVGLHHGLLLGNLHRHRLGRHLDMLRHLHRSTAIMALGLAVATVGICRHVHCVVTCYRAIPQSTQAAHNSL